MSAQVNRFFLQSVCAAAFAASVFATGAAQASCYPSDQEMSADQVSAFLTNPASLLSDNPSGGAALISKVRDLVASNPSTLQPILDLLKNSNAEQKAGVGNGLSQAYSACLAKDQALATDIQKKLAATGDKEALLAYTMATGGQVDTASVGGGAGSAGGVGGPTTGTASTSGGGGAAAAPQSTATDNVPTNYFTGGGVTSSAALSTSAF